MFCIGVCSWCSAQTISKAEYFFDTDPGPGNGTPISFTAGDPVTFTENVSTTGLSPGYHDLYIRTKTSSGHWSLFEGQRFFVDGGIIDAEYFFDGDPGIGNGTPLNVTGSNTIIQTISTAGLSDGDHYLFIRTKHDGNIWSLSDPRYFHIRVRIVKAEYFIDTDPGFGNGTPLTISTPGDIINFTPTITTPVLPDGNHYLFIRTKDILGKWSFIEPLMFTVDAALPIELFDFIAAATKDGRVKLQWTTASEVNNDFFTMEHSASAKEFTKIFQVSGAGTTTVKIHYEEFHENPDPGINYYRLKQTDFDGSFSYSKVVSADVHKVTSVYPNPIFDKWSVEFNDNGGYDQKYLEILDLTGRKIAHYKTDRLKDEFSRDGILTGTYILKIIFADARTEFLKINFR